MDERVPDRDCWRWVLQYCRVHRCAHLVLAQGFCEGAAAGHRLGAALGPGFSPCRAAVSRNHRREGERARGRDGGKRGEYDDRWRGRPQLIVNL
jgi:hypothetical protein